MTIEKGRPWGGPSADPSPAAVAVDDAELASLALRAVDDGGHLTARVLSGDLLTTLGVQGERPERDRNDFPMDLGVAYLGDTLDDRSDRSLLVPFVAHLVVAQADAGAVGLLGRLLGHGPSPLVSVMNAAWLGPLRLGPRAHPNDGLLDITEGRVPFAERREANRRARSGSHLPHPALSHRRVAHWECEFEQPMSIVVDGVDRGRHRTVRVEVTPDALTVVA